MSWFSDLFNAGDRAAVAQKQSLEQGYGDLSKLYSTGRDALAGGYAEALKPWQTQFDSSSRGATAYGDATGINGAEGMARARELFKLSPGYAEGLNSTLDQLDRRMASRGMLASGNTADATALAATNYANQKYGDYVSRLSPYLQQQTAGALGLSGVNTGLGTGLNQSYMGQGNMAYNKGKDIGAAQAQGITSDANTMGSFMGNIFGLGTKLLGFF